jgi:hypothetical protein
MIDKILSKLRQDYNQIKDNRGLNCRYKLSDNLSCGLAMFHLKDPSLLSFREQIPYRIENLKEIYGLESGVNIPSDNALRECLDQVSPRSLQNSFKSLLEIAKEADLLEKKKVFSNIGGYLCISVDGTGFFSSNEISCAECLIKHRRNGKIEYHHQMLASAIVNPYQKTVFPVWGEAIVWQDGSKKNDCEQNAAKRLFPIIREQLPNEKLLLLLDGLYPNAPIIRSLGEEKMSYIIVIKDGYVLEQIKQMERKSLKKQVIKKGKIEGVVEFAEKLILNGKNQDILVNYFRYTERNKETNEVIYFNEWITDISLQSIDIQELVDVARARWKIENETFNTLKNQNYNFEHSYGHGKKHLSTIFALLMLTAFFIDQIALTADEIYIRAKNKFRTYRAFLQRIRTVFDFIPSVSMTAILRFIAGDIQISLPKLE